MKSGDIKCEKSENKLNNTGDFWKKELTIDGISDILAENNKNSQKYEERPVKRFQKSYKSYKNKSGVRKTDEDE